MFFKKKKEKRKELTYTARMGISINLTQLVQWLKSESKDSPIPTCDSWDSFDSTYDYEIQILPVKEQRLWFFHKNSNEYSHSWAAIIELASHFPAHVDINNLCRNMPDLEIDGWNGLMHIMFDRRSLLLAPLNEIWSIMERGRTTRDNWETQKQEIKVPCRLDDEGHVTDYEIIHETKSKDGVLYRNQLAMLWIDCPDGPVVIRHE